MKRHERDEQYAHETFPNRIGPASQHEVIVLYDTATIDAENLRIFPDRTVILRPGVKFAASDATQAYYSSWRSNRGTLGLCLEPDPARTLPDPTTPPARRTQASRRRRQGPLMRCRNTRPSSSYHTARTLAPKSRRLLTTRTPRTTTCCGARTTTPTELNSRCCYATERDTDRPTRRKRRTSRRSGPSASGACAALTTFQDPSSAAAVAQILDYVMTTSTRIS